MWIALELGKYKGMQKKKTVSSIETQQPSQILAKYQPTSLSFLPSVYNPTSLTKSRFHSPTLSLIQLSTN